MPEPEDVFLPWLLSVPCGADMAAAADMEIARLERYNGSHPGPKRLAAVFQAFRRSLTRDAGELRLQ